MEARSVFFSRIFFVYPAPCVLPAFSCIKTAALPQFISERAFSTKLKPLPGAEYGGLRRNTLAGNFSPLCFPCS